MGFEDVWHLQGGILNYLEKTPVEQTRWDGECFVFDSRVSVDHDLEKGSYDQCYACRFPIDDAQKASDLYVPGVPARDVTMHTVTSRKNDSPSDKSRLHWLKRVARPT